jgi:hypothetical protein
LRNYFTKSQQEGCTWLNLLHAMTLFYSHITISSTSRMKSIP